MCIFCNLSGSQSFSDLGLWFLSLHQMTPLHVAAKSARFQVVVYLADQGNNINTKDSDGVSIVFMCVSEGNFFF